MTSKIVVYAQSGDVRVTATNPKTGEAIEHAGGIVPLGTSRDFYLHGDADFSAHEIQEGETIDDKQGELIPDVDPRESAAENRLAANRES